MRIGLAALLVLAVLAIPAFADQGGIPHDPHKAEHTCVVGLTNSDGLSGVFDTATVGTWEQEVGEDGQVHFIYSFSDTEGYDILAGDGTTVIGTVYSLNYDAKPDPQVILNFSCKAGSADTTFSFKSAVDVIPQLVNPMARASASLTLTDNSVPSNGAYATGLFGGKVYQARYNTTSVFTSLVDGFSVPAGSLTMSENYPLDGISYTSIAGTVTQMEAEYKFVLKRYDSASGTSNFVILPNVPEPSSILALATAMCGLVGFVVRKRK